jgi:short-subunit dehydrogenase
MKSSSLNLFVLGNICSSREEIRSVSETIKRDVGDVTIIISNAGIQSFKSFTECSENEFINTLRVNLFANYWVCLRFLTAVLSISI